MLQLTKADREILEGRYGAASALAMRVVTEAGRMLNAPNLLPIVSAHIDGCLYHGDASVAFAKNLVSKGGRVQVPTTLNVGYLDLKNPHLIRADAHATEMARRLMKAYVTLGCQPTWTCAPYQAGHRPKLGEHVAWGESNAVVFCNSVLGARTERYGDFLDICCAIAGRAPAHGLHLDENRVPVAKVDLTGLSPAMFRNDAFYAVLGTWLGREFGDKVVMFDGLPSSVDEDQLKALGAAAASSGAIGLFHILGRTPEIQTVEALRSTSVQVVLRPSAKELLTATPGTPGYVGQVIDAVALGSPHFSAAEMKNFVRLAAGRRFVVPVYVCTGRHTIEAMEPTILQELRAVNATLVVDTCVVVTPILPPSGGLLMTNSGKFAHYAKPLIGYDVVFGSLGECVESAVSGKLVRCESLWI